MVLEDVFIAPLASGGDTHVSLMHVGLADSASAGLDRVVELGRAAAEPSRLR